MVSSSSPEFVIRVYDGFTRDLYSLAQKKPGQVFRCSMDGGYGQVPNFMDFDRAILVAGGSGASFTFAIALDLIEQLPSRNVSSPIGFLRVVRSLESFKWFEPELVRLLESLFINVSIYFTRSGASLDGSAVSPTRVHDKSANLTNSVPSEGDIEMGFSKGAAPRVTADGALHTKIERPDIRLYISGCISNCTSEGQVGIGGCGPTEMIEDF